MLRFRSTPARSLLLLASLPLVIGLAGCFHANQTRQVHRTPEVDTGVGATILYPGQTAPRMASPATRTATPPGATAPAPTGSATGRAPPSSSVGGGSGVPAEGHTAPAGGELTSIGGSRIDEKRDIRYREDPIWMKYVLMPFTLVAAPFKWTADKLRDDDAEPTAEPVAPAPPPQARPAPRTDYESVRIEQMERELERRHGPSGSGAARSGQPSATRGASLSIADELAALQRSPDTPRFVPPTAPEPVERSAATSAGPTRAGSAEEVADGIVDRNGDGRIDLWIYRENGDITRKALDENFDGRPDRTLHYDPTTHQVGQVEEDSDDDGAIDSWTDYRDGKVVRRRVDADRNGQVDTWTFYRDGRISRHEQDTTGDGFRDRIGVYVDGRLDREEHDSDGDGRPDLTVHFDARERIVRREEDTNRDGEVDVISHYEGGRLSRRELLEPAHAIGSEPSP